MTVLLHFKIAFKLMHIEIIYICMNSVVREMTARMLGRGLSLVNAECGSY